MKAIVTEAFFDKTTGEGYNRGNVYEGDKDRIAELRDGGFLAGAPKQKKEPDPPKAGSPDDKEDADGNPATGE